MDIFLVLLTIAIPILFLLAKLELGIWVIPVFVMLYILFRYLNYYVHEQYFKFSRSEMIENQHNKTEKSKIYMLIQYGSILVLTSVLLFTIGKLLGDTLEKLCYNFHVSEFILGILLGIITSIPEFITFLESQAHHKEMNDHINGVVEATNNLFTSNTINLFVIQTIGIVLAGK